MNIVDGIKCGHGQELTIDCGCEYIYVNKRGSFDHKPQYSWTYTAPTSGLTMDFKSELVTEEEIKKRISLMTDECITSEMQSAIELFFKS